MLNYAFMSAGYRVTQVETNTCILNHLATALEISPVKVLESKTNPLVRHLLEQTGVYLRNQHEMFMHDWITAEYNAYKGVCDFIIVAGVRRLHETQAIKHLGGICIRVYRTTRLPATPSEDELHYLPIDYGISNYTDGLEALRNQVDEIATRLIKTYESLS
jgi:hypothetical protein